MPRKLTAEHREYIAKRLGQFASPPQIAKELETVFSVKVTKQRIGQLRGELKMEIREAQSEYLADMSDVPLAHVKERAKIYEQIVRDALCGKSRFDTSTSAGKAKMGKPDYYLALRALELMQRDTEYLKGASGNATAKEALTFLRALGSGPGDSDGVPAHAGPAGVN